MKHRDSGPIVEVPAGGRLRRFRLRPRAVLLALSTLFAVGVLVGVLVVSLWARPKLRDAETRLADLLAEIDALKSGQEALRTLLDAGPDEADGPDRLKLAPPGPEARTVRVAVLRSKAPLTLSGEALVVLGGPNPIPADGNALHARAMGAHVVFDGLTSLPSGARIENRLGPIAVGDRKYEGAIELFLDGDGLLVVNELDLEAYLVSVVASELPAGWPLETKKAVAVAARTYALTQRAQRDGPFHLEATTQDQVYDASKSDPTSQAAVAATHGEVVLRDGYLVTTYFSSACGGRSELPAEVWPDRKSWGNESVDCTGCADAEYASWSLELKPSDLAVALRAAGHPGVQAVRSMHIRSRTGSGRVARVDIGTDAGPVMLSGEELRRTVGYTKVKSATFDLELAGPSFRLSGRGFGHGVGLCQHGARGLVQGGADYRAVLLRYYPRARVEKIW